MAHGLHYGSSVFEGIRSYETPNGPAIFRLHRPHQAPVRVGQDLRHARFPTTLAQLNAACRDVITANGLEQRPTCARSRTAASAASACRPTRRSTSRSPPGRWAGTSAPTCWKRGIDACVSSWQRFAPNTIPAGAKAGGNYLSGQLVAREARRLGFGEGIALASTGLLSAKARAKTCSWCSTARCTRTPVSAALLNGITRNSIITLAKATTASR